MPNAISNWLPEDLTGSSSLNYIQEEMHDVCNLTSSGNKIIVTPLYGAFYDGNGFKISLVKNGIESVLVRDSDYRIIGLDYGRTKASSSKFGVYHFIILTMGGLSINNTDAKIKLSYQAFGGVMTSAAYNDIIERLTQLELNSNQVLNGSEISVEDIEEKLEIICKRINYHPIVPYNCVLTKTNDIKWNTFAVSSPDMDTFVSLTDHSTLKGTGKFTINSKYLNMTFELSYDIPVKLNTDGVGSKYFDIKINTTNQQISSLKKNEELKTDQYFTDEYIVPMVRMVVYNSSSTIQPKLYLQIALLTNREVEDASYTIYVSDESSFLMVPSAQTSKLKHSWKEAGNITDLPSNLYAISNPVLCLQDYYKVWDGNINLSMIEDTSWKNVTLMPRYGVQNNFTPIHTDNGFALFPFGIPTMLNLKSIKSFKVDIYDRLDKKMITKEFNTSSYKPFDGSINSTYADVNYYPYDNGLLELFVTINPTSHKPVIRAYAASGKNSYVNQRFDLRAIYMK